jgi:cytochrome c553
LGVAAPIAASYLYSAPTEQSSAKIPSYIAWTDATIATATSGSTVRGLILARRCEHCHGRQGFSADPYIPNLAGIDKLTIWKQMNDFRVGKRTSSIMQGVANELAIGDYADLAAYFSLLPTYPDPHENRSFPENVPPGVNVAPGARLILGGDGERGVPPCQACHGPIGHETGAPSLVTQNSVYIEEQLQEFAKGTRANDINMPMRSIAAMLTDEEKRAIAAYYGSGSADLEKY